MTKAKMVKTASLSVSGAPWGLQEKVVWMVHTMDRK